MVVAVLIGIVGFLVVQKYVIQSKTQPRYRSRVSNLVAKIVKQTAEMLETRIALWSMRNRVSSSVFRYRNLLNDRYSEL